MTLFTVLRFLGFWLDFIGVVFAVLGILLSLLIRTVSASTLGMVLLYFISLCSNIQWTVPPTRLSPQHTNFTQIRSFIEAEDSLVSLERVTLTINDAENEPEPHEHTEISNWPSQGEMKLQNLTLRWTDQGRPVIKRLNCEFSAGSKIGIVGFSGSGKSALVQVSLSPTPFSQQYLQGHHQSHRNSQQGQQLHLHRRHGREYSGSEAIEELTFNPAADTVPVLGDDQAEPRPV